MNPAASNLHGIAGIPRRPITALEPGAERTSLPVSYKRKYGIGAEVISTGGAHFRVWAPGHDRVAVELMDANGAMIGMTDLEREPSGYFSGYVPQAGPGMRYRYRLPHGSFPDPASRYQPEGPHGPSELIDPDFAWSDDNWRGRPAAELVMYELHLGTFTPEGTWAAAMAQLPELARIGITALEVMPVAEFPGSFGWGYDGVDLFAPTRLYGVPNDVRRFVARAHELGLMVILDVVYNHLGPDGCFLAEFSPDYFTSKYECEWGQPLNFDGENAGPVREFFLTNARYWVEEYHFDGLRLDATQQIYDASPTHIVAEIGRTVRDSAPHRKTFVVAENEPQAVQFVRAIDDGGHGLDAMWNDDFHHSATVAATGRAGAYYGDYRGAPQEFVSAFKYGILFQGQLYAWQRKRRGSCAFDVPMQRFVVYLQNHDQIANSLRGLRLNELTSPGMLRAMTAVLLLSPSIPLLFQGQEFASSAPFLYFADHDPGLARLVADGRSGFLSQFRTIAAADAIGTLAPPHAAETFRRCALDFSERERHRPVYQLHQDLLRLRREDSVLRAPVRVDGAVIAEHAFVVRFFGGQGQDRLLVVNLHRDLHFSPAPEPLLAPIDEHGWDVLWSSEAPGYGGLGTPALETAANWIIPGSAAFVLSPNPNRELPRARLNEKD